ncbi:MAG TPA: prepilin-type N-terminal cleavage/methylation domain-containing protein, partial [Gemmatimonadales bacterium]|nr:prepilin-type N-terminal cleavage/methylation domain-containing protein [Gemmatimonadales bacterium]
MQRPSSGFTLVEVLVALVVLALGVLALTGSSAVINRMIGRGKIETHAAMAAARRMEVLRRVAGSTTPRCSASEFTSGGPTLEDGLLASWTVPPSGSLRRVRVSVSYLTLRGSRSAVLETNIA